MRTDGRTDRHDEANNRFFAILRRPLKMRGPSLSPYAFMASNITVLLLPLRTSFTNKRRYRTFDVTWLLWGAFAYSCKAPVSYVMSVCPHVSARLPMGEFPWSLMLVTFMKVSWENPDLLKIGRKLSENVHREIRRPTSVAGDIKSPIKLRFWRNVTPLCSLIKATIRNEQTKWKNFETVSKLRQSAVTSPNYKPTKPTVTDKVHPPRVGHVQENRNLHQNYVHGGGKQWGNLSVRVVYQVLYAKSLSTAWGTI
jgi:hypothetical protein